ncbi:hypothetical protein BH11ARM2_BH11ARM2_14350 [soil metagenome]
MRSRQSGAQQGFGLLEMLVVITVIALLVTILMPTFSVSQDGPGTQTVAQLPSGL